MKRISLTWRFLIGILIISSISLWIFYWLMNPPMSDLGLMALFLSITAFVSAFISYVAYRMGWVQRSPSIRWAILGGYVLSGLVTFLNVWITARLMFTSQHDLLLATVLLLFATGIAIVMGLFFSFAINDRISVLDNAAQSIAGGDLQARVPVEGHDEIADLGRTFNKMAAQLQDANRKQKEAENLRRDLIAWVSHDLLTPLASIRAIVEALADGVVEEPKETQRYLRTAQRDISALSTLIDDLFQVAQMDAGGIQLDFGLNALSDLISDTLESFSELAARQGINLTGEVESNVDPVWMDAQRIGRVLNNLVKNGLRHTPAGGIVELHAVRKSQVVLVEISDTGEGIQPEDISHVFDSFYRGEKSRSRATGGAGLGLTIARGFIQAHGGEIHVESKLGEGTRFIFTLPERQADK